ncbi:MAG: hypothetical protein ACE5MI_14420 [Acidimicrobiia bacterium]
MGQAIPPEHIHVVHVELDGPVEQGKVTEFNDALLAVVKKYGAQARLYRKRRQVKADKNQWDQGD